MTIEFLYHGSRTPGIKQLTPRRDSHPGDMPDAPPAVYAGKDPAYCAGHACRGNTRDGIDRGYQGEWKNGEPTWGPFTLSVPRALAHYLEDPVSVYTLRAEDFELLPDIPPAGQNYWSLVAVPVLEEAAFPSVRDAVESLGGKVKILAE